MDGTRNFAAGKEQTGSWGKFPKSALKVLRHCTPGARAVYQVLVGGSDGRNSSLYLAHESIAVQAGYSRRHVIRCVQELETAGLVVVTRYAWRRCLYRLTWSHADPGPRSGRRRRSLFVPRGDTLVAHATDRKFMSGLSDATAEKCSARTVPSSGQVADRKQRMIRDLLDDS